jgi:hypothetical protein
MTGIATTYILFWTRTRPLDDFYSWATEDDLAYALTLIREARAELLVQEAELMDEVGDVSVANSVLKQFQL